MQFYVINKKPKGDTGLERFRTDFEYDESVAKGDAPKCAMCGAFVGMLEGKPPYRVHLETWGDKFGDLAFWLSDFLVSRWFRDEYERSGLTGLASFNQVELLSHTGHRQIAGHPPDYFRVLPATGGARIDLVASGVEWGDRKAPTCKHCLSGGGVLERWTRIVLDEDSWNGDDIFYAFGIPGSLIVSQRFLRWANQHEFRNLICEPCELNSRDFYPVESRNTS